MNKYKAKVVYINPKVREEVTFEILGSKVECFLGDVPADIAVGQTYLINFAFLDDELAEQFSEGIFRTGSERDDSFELSLSLGDAPMSTEYAFLNGKTISIQIESSAECLVP
jgi:hypothetical protein